MKMMRRRSPKPNQDQTEETEEFESNRTMNEDECCDEEEEDQDQQQEQEQEPIYYFGIGPIINKMVRKRQRVNVTNIRAALLPDYRLTFCYGGIVNVVYQRGYEVHGVIMKFDSREEWNTFLKTNAGQNHSELVEVFPYTNNQNQDASSSSPEQEEEEEEEPSMLAHVFVLQEYEQATLEKPIEQLPTERYLRLIANGMREYQLDEDYIADQIMSVPFVPARKPENYLKFPSKKSSLPKITFGKYQRMCQRTKNDDIYFVLGTSVFKMNKPYSRLNPGVAWFIEHCHGRPDFTFMLHQVIVEPDLPVVCTKEEITQDHIIWAENQSVEFLANCGVTATKAYQLQTENDETSTTSSRWSSSLPRWKIRRQIQYSAP